VNGEFPQCRGQGSRCLFLELHHVRQKFIYSTDPCLVDEIADGVSKMRLDLTMDLLDLKNGLLGKMSVKPLVQAFVSGEEHQSQRAFRNGCPGKERFDARYPAFNSLWIDDPR